MNYQLVYNNLIAHAKQAPPIDYYTEKHHIILKCMGGANDKSNLVKLTAKEHFIAHLLLCKIYPDNYKLLCAVWYMCGTRKYKISVKQYEKIRLQFRKEQQKKGKLTVISEKCSFLNKKHTDKTKQLISKVHKGKIVSQKTRSKLSLKGKGHIAWNKGKTCPNLAGENNYFYKKHLFGKDNPNFGHKWTKEQKEALSKKRKGCIGLSGSKNPMFGKIGINSPRYGTKHSEETKAKMRKPKRKPQ